LPFMAIISRLRGLLLLSEASNLPGYSETDLITTVKRFIVKVFVPQK